MLVFLHKLLLLLPPEISHAIAKLGLCLYQVYLKFNPPQKGKLLPITRGAKTLNTAGRVGLAAGFDKNAEIYLALSSFGFGFLELGTVTPEPQAGNSRPRLWRISEQGLVNHMGFNSVGFNDFRSNVKKYKKLVAAPLWINIGKNRSTPNEEAHEDYWTLFEELDSVADAFVVNLSSPNTPGLVSLQNEEFLKKLLEKAPKGKSLFIKLSPDLTNAELKDICLWAKAENQVTGIVLTNTSRKLALKYSRHENGGLSGPLLLERSLECVSVARETVKEEKIIVGVGGIDSLESAQKMRSNGADLIEIYTGFVYGGVPLVKKLAAELT